MLPNLKTPPVKRPVTLDQAKAHCRVDHDDDNHVLLQAINAAVEWVETNTGRALITRTYEIGQSDLGGCIELPMPPLQSVESITYVDEEGNQQTLAADQYQVQTWVAPGYVLPAYDVTWPKVREQINSVVVEYKAGYGEDAEDVPADIRSALLLLVGHFYENREQNVIGTVTAELKFGVENLLNGYRIFHI